MGPVTVAPFSEGREPEERRLSASFRSTVLAA